MSLIKWIAAIALAALSFAALSAVAYAQPAASSTSRLVWDQAAPALVDVTGYIYEAAYDDGVYETVTGVTCAGTTSPFVCAGAIKALTPTTHTVRVRAVQVIGTTRLESPASNVLSFRFVPVPTAPAALRIGV